jgi:hypothetical protein
MSFFFGKYSLDPGIFRAVILTMGTDFGAGQKEDRTGLLYHGGEGLSRECADTTGKLCNLYDALFESFRKGCLRAKRGGGTFLKEGAPAKSNHVQFFSTISASLPLLKMA